MNKLFLFIIFFISNIVVAQKFVPPVGKQLLIIGQDLEAVKNYSSTKKYPSPGGHTVYVSLYGINSAAGPYPFGGLGEDRDGKPVAAVDWGAGLVSAHTAAFDPLYKNSVLVIGLSLNEGSKKIEGLIKGDFDAEIERLAKFINKLNKPVYLRIGYEFEGAWNPSYKDPETYKAAFRRVVEGLRKQGVINFATVWQTSASPIDDIIENKREKIEDWYPGDDVVDWMGLSWFLNPLVKSSTSPIKTTQGELAEELLDLARKHNKPVMIAESAPQGFDIKMLTKRNITGILDGPAGEGLHQLKAKQIWKQWYEPFFRFIDKNKELIKAVAYINTHWDKQSMWGSPYNGGYWGNSQVQDNPYISKQWKEKINKKNWLHGDNILFSILNSSNRN